MRHARCLCSGFLVIDGHLGIGLIGGSRSGGGLIRLVAGGGTSVADQPDVIGAEGRLEVGEHPVVVADLEVGPGFIDRPADLLEPD